MVIDSSARKVSYFSGRLHTCVAEADAFTKFFHLHSNHRHRKNFVVHHKVGGVLVSDQDEKAGAADSFYGELLGSSPERGFSLDLDYMGVQTHGLCELGDDYYAILSVESSDMT
jgi:hypothetical protein